MDIKTVVARCWNLRRILAISVLGVSGSGPAFSHPIDDLRPGCWYEVPNSRLESEFPVPPPPGATGPTSVMDAWSGGAFDTSRDRLIVWGGGHENYSGNEVYVFDVNSLAWTRLDEPSDPVQEDVAHYADGRPSARETYNYIQYAENVDRLFSLGFGSAYGRGSVSGDAVDAYDFGTLTWTRGRDKPRNGTLYGAFSAYDPLTGKLYHHGTLNDAALIVYDPEQDMWRGPYQSHYIEHYVTAAIDPNRRIMVATGGNDNQVLRWKIDDLGSPANPGSPSVVPTTGNRALEGATAPGFVYDPVSDRFVGWSGGASVYTLDPDTWRWIKIDPAPDNTVVPTRPNETGTYGRFRYIPSKNAFIVVNGTDENVFMYKLRAPRSSSLCADDPGGGGAVAVRAAAVAVRAAAVAARAVAAAVQVAVRMAGRDRAVAALSIL